MTDIEALRARMREAAEKAKAAGSRWYACADERFVASEAGNIGARTVAEVYDRRDRDFIAVATPNAILALDAEITRLREELDRVTRERDGAYLTSQQAAQSYSNLMRVKEDIDAQRQDAEAALAVVTRERDEALEQVEAYKLIQSLDKDSAYVIRNLLNERNVPSAAFIDDHVANAIAQRDAAEAALAKRDEEVARYKRKLMQGEAILAGWTRIDRIKLATGEMTAQEARTALAVAKAIAASVRSAIAAEPEALTQEPTNAE